MHVPLITYMSSILIGLVSYGIDYSADLCGSVRSTSNFLRSSVITAKRKYVHLPEISPSEAPQPLLPLLAPSPLAPFTNSTVPKLSGLFSLLKHFQLSIII